MKVLPQYLDFKGSITQFFFYWKRTLDEGVSRPWSCNCQMEFGELKLNLWTSIGLQKISTSWTNLKIFTILTRRKCKFPNKFEWIWTWDTKVTGLWIGLETNLCEDTFGPLGRWGGNGDWLLSSIWRFQCLSSHVLYLNYSAAIWTSVAWKIYHAGLFQFCHICKGWTEW